MARKLLLLSAAIAFLSAALGLWPPAAGAQSGAQAGDQAGDQDVLSRDSVWRDPEIPALGNPDGDITIVEYFDYRCPVCKYFHADLTRAVREDGHVRLVSKGWPIFGGVSIYAARIALATKYQGKFAAAHEALFTARTALSETAIRGLLSNAGVDVARADRDLQAHGATIDATLARNNAQALALGFLGTPGFIIGPFRVNRALDTAQFKQALKQARVTQPKQ